MAKNIDLERRIGATVRTRRLAVGLTQEVLGERVEVTYQQIQKYESGSNRISASRMMQLAAALGTTASELMSEVEAGPATGA